ncbi:MAG: hypothetical protein O2809_09880 [Proteobacteria bacterium]|nr:hypothetical protein [Pseudomonadota bacterium]
MTPIPIDVIVGLGIGYLAGNAQCGGVCAVVGAAAGGLAAFFTSSAAAGYASKVAVQAVFATTAYAVNEGIRQSSNEGFNLSAFNSNMQPMNYLQALTTQVIAGRVASLAKSALPKAVDQTLTLITAQMLSEVPINNKGDSLSSIVNDSIYQGADSASDRIDAAANKAAGVQMSMLQSNMAQKWS